MSESQKYWIDVARKQAEEIEKEKSWRDDYESYIRSKVHGFNGIFDGREKEVFDFIFQEVEKGRLSNITPFKVSVKGQSPDKDGKYPYGQFNRILVKRVFDKINLDVVPNTKKKGYFKIV